jgi:hypothetical protein
VKLPLTAVLPYRTDARGVFSGVAAGGRPPLRGETQLKEVEHGSTQLTDALRVSHEVELGL